MLLETETPYTPPQTEWCAEQPIDQEQRGQAPFFDSPEHPEWENYVDSAEPTFVETLDDELNAFRFPHVANGGNRYRTTGYKDLKGVEISAIPSIEAQISHLEGMMEGYIKETVAYAGLVGFDRHDPELQVAADQIVFLVAQAKETTERYSYWEQFYQTSEENAVGRFVKWNGGRRVAQTLAPILASRAAASRRRATAAGVQEALLARDNSDLANHQDVRRCAYRERMDAKIGLAADRVLTEHRIAMLKEILPFQDDDPATPNLIRHIAPRQIVETDMPSIDELMAKLKLTDISEFLPERVEESIPF